MQQLLTQAKAVHPCDLDTPIDQNRIEEIDL